MSKAGGFEIRIWGGGHPIWAELHYDGKLLAQIDSLKLRDLAHAVDQARREARQEAQRMDPKRVDDY